MDLISHRAGEFGIIAVGERPVGVIAVGGSPIGFIAIGGAATGVIALGLFATGIFAIGPVAVGLFAFSVGVGAGGSVHVTGFGIGGRVRGVGGAIGLDVAVVGSMPRNRLGAFGRPGWWPRAWLFSGIIAGLYFGGFYLSDLFQNEVLGSYYLEMASLIAASIALITPFVLRRSRLKAEKEAAQAAEAKAKRTATATATIVSVEKTGLRINHEPQVRISLEADLGSQVWKGTVKRIVGTWSLSQMPRGAYFPLHYDPNDLDNIEIDFEGLAPNE